METQIIRLEKYVSSLKKLVARLQKVTKSYSNPHFLINIDQIKYLQTFAEMLLFVESQAPKARLDKKRLILKFKNLDREILGQIASSKNSLCWTNIHAIYESFENMADKEFTGPLDFFEYFDEADFGKFFDTRVLLLVSFN